MNAAEVINAARRVGVQIHVDGGDLVLNALARPRDDVLELLRHHKADIVALLRPGAGYWSAEEWLAYFDERAGIAKFADGLARPQAEVQAFEACISEWLNRTFTPSSPDRCFECGGGDDPYGPSLPHGTATIGHVWLHRECWRHHRERRWAEAVASLEAMGVFPVSGYGLRYGALGGDGRRNTESYGVFGFDPHIPTATTN